MTHQNTGIDTRKITPERKTRALRALAETLEARAHGVSREQLANRLKGLRTVDLEWLDKTLAPRREIQILSIETGKVVRRYDTRGMAPGAVDRLYAGLIAKCDADRFVVHDTGEPTEQLELGGAAARARAFAESGEIKILTRGLP